ncbi:unnamed protein product [Dicrocoelium dendriticum]|nr:unnamed protein product [Dicrocoelium dendriticum]
MMNSQLSTETLRRIWDLSDIDADGSLDKGEFVLAMHLIHLCVEGEMLPDVLPQNLIPSGKERYFTGVPPPPPTCSFTQLSIAPNLALVPSSKAAWSNLGEAQPSGHLSPHPIISPIPSSSWPYFASNQPFSYPPWAISPEELAKSSRIFSTIDLDADGLVSGTEVRDILLRSGLQQSILAQIWDLVDIQCSGMLNCEQFAVAMHLATEQLSSMPYANPLPIILPPALVPPSLRPLPPDPAMFEESNRLIAEIEALNRSVFEKLQVNSLDGSVNSLDTGLGGSTRAAAAQNGATTFPDPVWPDTSVPAGRPLGAASVPLSVMSSNPVSAFDETPSLRGQAVSALGLPIVSGDPFRDADPFATTSGIRDFSSALNAQKDDLFGPTSLFPSSDPFKYIDPFGGDPFSVPTNTVNGKNCSDIISAFDPFTSTVNPVMESKSIVTGADFDAVFGAPDAPPPTSVDPFGADPFSSVEQKALCSDLEPKRSPPPRPKTQPGAGKQARERKSIGDTPDFTSSLGARHSVGSLPDFSVPTVGLKSSAIPSTRVDGRLPTSADTQKWSSISRGRYTNKPKKEGDSGSIWSSHSSSKTGCKPCDTSDWNPSGLTEDQQLSIATMESQRLAQLEAKARRQEEADLELAIMLSKMNSAAT